LEIPHDDIPKILSKYLQYKQQGFIEYDHLGFVINESEIRDDVYLPKYYNPEIPKKLKSLGETHDLLVFGDLVKTGVLNIATGDEVGKLAYGMGNIPFIRTSDIAN
jgi:type I restriction enzyme M protein